MRINYELRPKLATEKPCSPGAYVVKMGSREHEC